MPGEHQRLYATYWLFSHFPVLHFLAWQFCATFSNSCIFQPCTFHCVAFSCLTFSVAPPAPTWTKVQCCHLANTGELLLSHWKSITGVKNETKMKKTVIWICLIQETRTNQLVPCTQTNNLIRIYSQVAKICCKMSFYAISAYCKKKPVKWPMIHEGNQIANKIQSNGCWATFHLSQKLHQHMSINFWR